MAFPVLPCRCDPRKGGGRLLLGVLGTESVVLGGRAIPRVASVATAVGAGRVLRNSTMDSFQQLGSRGNSTARKK